uniref:Uncharacterized protein n=1 Tax=Rhizophora mucronata TaxID=61149 RepID=A0A2P2IU88_RHIMU
MKMKNKLIKASSNMAQEYPIQIFKLTRQASQVRPLILTS